MKLQNLIFALLMTCTFFISCGESTEKKEGDQKETVEMKQTETNDTETTEKSDAQASDADQGDDAAISKIMKELLKGVADSEKGVMEIIDAPDASWIDKISKLSNNPGAAKKFAELGDSPEAILNKVKEMAKAAE